MLQKPTAILFDWDNTLVDTWQVLHIATNKTLEKYNLPLRTFDQIKNNAYQSLRESFPLIFGDHWQKAADFFYQTIRELSMDGPQQLVGAFELLSLISASGVPMGIVSNKTSALLQNEVKQLQWEKFFGAIIGAGDASNDKPSPDPINFALYHLQKEANSTVWYIGDMEGDWECARAANCQPIAVYRKPQDSSIPFFENNGGLKRFLEGYSF